MRTYQLELQGLNKFQRQAVEQINGPVLVVAGPGTGKTQLISARVANILSQDSTLLPTNILCLTFTESGQTAMQRRLIEIMGEAGAHVAVHTFHSFGSEIIANYPQYFHRGGSYAPAEELTKYEILESIIEALPHNHLLAAQNQGEFVYLNEVQKRIAQFKKAALDPEDLSKLVADCLKFVEAIEPDLIEVFDVKSFSSKSDIDRAAQLFETARQYKSQGIIYGYKPLSEVFLHTFGAALQAANDSGKTKPLNDWKKDWFSRDKDGHGICKQRTVLEKIEALTEIYTKYQEELNNRRLFDFDDMIMRAVHALETRADLAYELQEQYQYFLIDEFQDTNAGQLRLIQALARHPVNENKPNILVVGDDDQAIYAFQGAELSNILDFKESYQEVSLVTLTENYRSDQQILEVSRQIILQGVDRLENRYQEINKTLVAKAKLPEKGLISRKNFLAQSHEFMWVAESIKKQLENGYDAQEIAVICREHKHLEALLPYLAERGVPVHYERKSNALDDPQIKQLLILSRVVSALSEDDLDTANGLLPELLSAEYWDISAESIWKLSLSARQAYEETRRTVFWLELMHSGEHGNKLKEIADFLLEATKFSRAHSLEQTLDFIIGTTGYALAKNSDEEPEAEPRQNLKLTSPFRNYYYSDNKLSEDPGSFIYMLASLSAIRNRLRQYRADKSLTLNDFVWFCELSKKANSKVAVKNYTGKDDKSVRLLSAHGSKGLEFGTVYILSAVQSVWDKPSRGSNIPLAPNMQTIAHSAKQDDALRLFYVALTRAKQNLIITTFNTKDDGKEQVPFAALEHAEVQKLLPRPETAETLSTDNNLKLESAIRGWQDSHYHLPRQSMKELLSGRLQNYKLSATHLNNFLDVTGGGPKNFLLGNLLQFPSAMSPSAAYGSAMHTTLEYMHSCVIESGKLPPTNKIIDYFEAALRFKRLSAVDQTKYINRGQAAIKKIVKQLGPAISSVQKPEINFFSQGGQTGEAKLTGKLDVLEISANSARIIDYKTGQPLKNWDQSGKSVYEKVKLHKYRQQLLFYKLLVDGSRSYGDRGVRGKIGELVFVEPDQNGIINKLELVLEDNEELERLRKLIEAVWQHIMELNFPETDKYPGNIKGIIEFENDLLSGH